jgi:hypothetical protein
MAFKLKKHNKMFYSVTHNNKRKEPFIIPGTDAAIWSKTLGLLATITLKVAPFSTNAPFPALVIF